MRWSLGRRLSLPRCTSSHRLRVDDRRRCRSLAHRRRLPHLQSRRSASVVVALVIAHKIVPAAICNAMHAARIDTFLAPVPRKKSDGAKKTCATHAVEETSEDDVVFALHNCTTTETHKIKSSRTEPIWIHPKVNGCQLQMELDTGSALTILPASMFHEHFDLPLQPTSTMPSRTLVTVSGRRECFVHTCVTTARSLRPTRTWSTLMDLLWLGVTGYRTLCLIGVACTISRRTRRLRCFRTERVGAWTPCAHVMLLCSALTEVICNPVADISRSAMVLNQSF